MTKNPLGDVIAGPQAVDLHRIDPDTPIQDKTAMELRLVCEKAGVDFDGNLTEAAARERIELLKQEHGIDLSLDEN